MKNIKIFAFLTFLIIPTCVKSQLLINEIMATNASSLMETDYYNFPDWLELYNSGTVSINLASYYLSDDKSNLKQWKFSSYTLISKKYYYVYCDKENKGKHTNFGLSADRETLYLSNSDGIIIDSVQYGKQFPNVSFGRDPSNLSQWLYCSTPSPGTANQVTSAVRQSPKPIFSHEGGRINSTVSLSLSGINIKYTKDGSEPLVSSTVYSAPISINKTMVVKTKTYQEGFLDGEPKAATFFYNEHTFTLPVVAISFTPDYFYDDMIGIYVVGNNGTEGLCGSMANWNQNWERAAYLEYIDNEGVKQISQPIGIKLSGGCTRGRDQKSMSLYARSKYGKNDFDYPFFIQKSEIESFKSVLLRNSGNDQDQTLLRDAFIQSLVNKSMDIDYQSYQPVIVYFNGEYQGIFNLREKVDEDYFNSNYNISSDSIDFVEGILKSDADNCYEAIRGSTDEYKEIISFISSNSLSNDENYEKVASQIDIQEYINYMVLQTYIGNRDWPGNNLKFWKKMNNGRWRWILFDTDYGFGFRISDNPHTYQSLHMATATDGASHPNPPWSTLLFRKILENDGFKKQFLSSYFTHIYTSFTPDWCNYVLDSLSARIDYEITYNQQQYGRTKNDWLGYLEVLKTYAVNRNSFMPDYVKSFFNLNSSQVTLTVANKDVSAGKVRMNGALVQSYPFSVKTYQELPLTLIAVPEMGYRFVIWKNTDGSTYSENITISGENSFNLSVEPVFEPIDKIEGIYLNEITCISNSFYDELNEKSGFIELFNASDQEAILYGFFLSDDKSNFLKYRIPDSTVIPAKGFITFYADGQGKQSIMHTPFKLSEKGESVILSQKSGNEMTVLDSVSFSFLIQDYSYGKYSDGNGAWQYMIHMTPGAPNDPEKPIIGVESIQLTANFNIYPNPSDGHIFISAENNDDIVSERYYIDLLDLSGKVVYPRVWINNSYNEMDMCFLYNGIYFARIFYNDRLIKTYKIVISK